ncbi:MAG: NADPH-dependent 7-cyano-7-deazaguanine reductase QueF, partial [Lentisphaerae bacterium]|nr:NADPH-dependent 7-cyano-7-deazaguanine reductase QueF [Lentisphaerota bacterium]
MNENFLNEGPLNKKCGYISKYDKTLLFSIPREMQRKNMGISSEETPVNGFDTLNSYELSWLNDKGKPIVAIGCF